MWSGVYDYMEVLDTLVSRDIIREQEYIQFVQYLGHLTQSLDVFDKVFEPRTSRRYMRQIKREVYHKTRVGKRLMRISSLLDEHI
jgi:hypothetical protein